MKYLIELSAKRNLILENLKIKTEQINRLKKYWEKEGYIFSCLPVEEKELKYGR